ncbi:hypothetical protein [Streptosporangium sp. NPDC006930]|uniref:hypothetical protein n=1 Tax=Streptosporangium sp. NPDC006930 TaxID=3154783 RepID=UPI003440700B
MTPEQAAEQAAHVLKQATAWADKPETVSGFVQVADAWTRLHTALAHAPKTIDPAPGEPAEIAGLPAEVRTLVHAVDRMREDWAEANEAGKRELWQRLHDANDKVWNR